ncbi:sensor domain-containing diguanylate cyclase [Marinomonas sp. RSW2]|uniref:diguanylate cyclase n=1 Tax=Marinomonas maritima TaxID=2940935 RepID=A0ABT5WBX0_9GAMM|nr:sensor domain-containing diguanylate cyclase [Marinomonas maritima]MDE8602313.1 sensor domain-containing diguanylate cyclase [Marinomonas maritima]
MFEANNRAYLTFYMKQFSKLHRQIFAITTTLALITIVIISISIASLLYTQGIDNAESVLRNKNRSVTTLIDGYVAPLRKAVEYTGSSASGVDHSRFREQETKEKFLSLFEVLQNTIPNIHYIFSGYEDGSLLINNYTAPAGFNSTVRPWYLAAIKSNPLISEGVPYQDINSKKWLVSFGKTLLDADNKIVGVISIDAGMDSIVKALAIRDEKYPTIYNFVMDTEGKILIHPDETLPDTLHQQIFSHLPEKVNASGSLAYNDGDQKKLAHFDRIDELGWIVVTEVNLADIRQPIVKTITSTLLMIVIGSLFTTWLMSHILSRHLILPLKRLQQRVQEITEGKDELGKYVFPNNEIGKISEAIEKLTEKALIQKNIELKDKNTLLSTISHTDQLTSIANRRKMMEVLHTEVSSYEQNQHPFSVLMFDVDHFKHVNDTFGHEVGDQVLIRLAQTIKATIHKTDTLGRWGGEEFVIVCPNTDKTMALNIAEKVFSAIHLHNFPLQINITISLGLSEFTNNHSLESILVEIDQKMYRAKQLGRNQIQT